MKETKPIHIDMKLESSDILKFIFRLFFATSKIKLISSIFIFCLVLPLWSFMVIQRILLGQSNTIMWFAYLPIIILGIVLFLIIFVIIHSRKNAKQTHLIFTEEEIEVIAPHIKIQTNWVNYRKIQETKKDFLLFSTTPNGSFPIPKRFFESEMQIQNFKELVREKLGDKAELNTD